MEKKQNRGSRFVDRSGEKIGYLTIIGLSTNVYKNPKTGKTTLKWDYICDCGKHGSITSTTYTKRLKSKFKTSCGCDMGGLRDTTILLEQGKKICPKCNELLPVSKFSVRKRTSTGLDAYCKKCKSENDREYRNNPKYRLKILEDKKKYYSSLKDDKEKYELVLKRQREIRDRKKEYQSVMNNPLRRCKSSIRRLIYSSLKVRNIYKSKLCMKTEEILGCSFEHFKKHIENQFVGDMSWDNRGEWHIDHIVPLSMANTVDELLKLSHYTNLQPLSAKDNLIKSNVILDEHMELYHNLLK